jgi:hypothetical protein
MLLSSEVLRISLIYMEGRGGGGWEQNTENDSTLNNYSFNYTLAN